MSRICKTTPPRLNGIAANGGSVGNAGASILDSPFIETSFQREWTGSLVLTVTLATLQATLGWLLTSMGAGLSATAAAADSVAPNNANFIVAKSALPAGITLGAGGLFTFNNPAIATHVVQFTFGDLPLPLGFRPVYTFTSGGGTVSLTLNLNSYGIDS